MRDFWIGHAIGTVSKACLNMVTDEMRNLHMTAEEFLSVEKTSRQELEQRTEQEPTALEDKVVALSKELENVKGRLSLLVEAVDMIDYAIKTAKT